MNFKEKLISVLEFLGFKQKFEDKSLSQEEFNAVVAEYQKKYQATLTDDLAAEQAARQTEQQAAEFQTMLNTIQSVLSGTEPTAAADNKEGEPQNQTQANATLEGILESIKGTRADFKAMAEKPTPDVPVQTVTASPLNVNGFSNTPQYLFGVEHPMFSMKDRWNQIAANPRAAAALTEVDEQVDGAAFYKAACNYA